LSYNFLECEWVYGRKLVTTRIEMPMWCTSDILNFMFRHPVLEVKLRKIRTIDKDFDSIVESMYAVDWTEDVIQHIDSRKILKDVRKTIPLCDVIHEWMRISYAHNVAISVMKQNYANVLATGKKGTMEANFVTVGGIVDGKSDDPYIPGLQVQDISYVSETGETVANNGFAKLNTPYGIDHVPILDKKTIIKPKMLAWTAIPWVGTKQWIGAIVKWLKLVRNPFDLSKGGIPNVLLTNKDATEGLSSPVFLAHIPPRFGLRNDIELDIASNKDQRIEIYYRDPRDFTRALCKLTVPLQGNAVNKIRYSIRSLFGVPPMLMHIETPDNGLIAVKKFNVRSYLFPFLIPI